MRANMKHHECPQPKGHVGRRPESSCFRRGARLSRPWGLEESTFVINRSYRVSGELATADLWPEYPGFHARCPGVTFPARHLVQMDRGL